MLAGSVTGGIPGSGVDRSAIALATGHDADGCDADGCGAGRTVEAGVAVRCDGGTDADGWLSEPGRETSAKIATTAVTARNTPPSQARRRVRRSASQPILSIPILSSGLNKVRLASRQPPIRRGSRYTDGHGSAGSGRSWSNRPAAAAAARA